MDKVSKYAASASAFRANVARDLADPQLRENFRGAMDYLVDKRKTAFCDADELAILRRQCELIKQRCLAKLPDLLEQLEQNLERNGIRVHWAQTPTQANEIIAQLIIDQQIGLQQANTVVKGKSMVSEETALNDHLQALGIECLETDMGEYIVQLADQHPSHIIMPAIHQNKQQVADLFAQHVAGFDHSTDVDTLIAAGRQVLRHKFCQAEVGITGVNFAVAETGTLCLVENEGNGRMCSTVPELHIAITGIEKVVESLADVPPLLSILTRSATGQSITTYFNMISHPRKTGEKDGPKAVHLVLLDNGRSEAFADQQLRQTLQCIRCGACMNHCPVYTRIGGHAFGTVYPGPIGQILTPHQLGLAATKDLPTASTLCGACAEVCPVNIPIPSILLRLRNESVRKTVTHPATLAGQGVARSTIEASGWQLWALIHRSERYYGWMMWLLSRFGRWLPKNLGPWTSVRTAPKPTARTLHQQLKAKRRSDNGRRHR